MATTGLGRLAGVDDGRPGGRITLARWVKLIEGPLVGGTRTLIGGFDTVATGLSPEMEDLEAKDERGTAPDSFCTRPGTAFVGLVPGTSGLGSGSELG